MRKICLIIVLFVGIVLPVNAQLDEPGADPDVPLDGGLSILTIAAAALGARRFRDKRLEN